MRFPLAVLLVVIFAHPLWAQAADETTEAPSGPIAVSEGLISDADIATRIDDIRRQLGGLSQVQVSVNAGVVRLSGEVLATAEAEEFAALAERVDGVVAVENEVVENTDVGERLAPAIDRIETRISTAIAYVPLAIVAFAAAALVGALGFLLARWDAPWNRIAPNAFIADIYRQIVRIVFVLGGIVLALDILGAAALLGTILGAAGLVGLAIGFAVRDTVENFIASVMLSVRQPFQPNDLVEIEGDLGKVIRLTSRATILLSPDGNHIRIPNSTVFKARIVNFSRNDSRRFSFEIGVETDSDLGAVRDMIERHIQALPFVLDEPRALVWIETMNESGVVLTCTGWIDQAKTDFRLARGAALREVKDAIEASGVAIPDTTYRIRLEGSGLGSITETPAPDPRPGPAPRAEPVPEPVSIDRDDALDRIIDAERRAEADKDLLERGGAEE